MSGGTQSATPLFDLSDATVEDAVALARINLASWRTGYAHMLPAAFLEALRAGRWEERLHARIAAAEPGQFTIVARDPSGRPLGFVSGGPNRDEPPAVDGEIYAIYVDPARWSGGAGSALLRAAEERLSRNGFRTAAIWVFTRNARARRFYERRRWRLEPYLGYWRREGLRRQLVCYGKRLEQT